MKTRRSARENEHHHRRNGKDGEKKTTTEKKKMKKKKNATRNRAWNATKETVGEDECRDEEDVKATRARDIWSAFGRRGTDGRA